jgi:hypothetical protein
VSEEYGTHISESATRVVALAGQSERLRARMSQQRWNLAVFGSCAVIDLFFMVWDWVHHDPVVAYAIQAALTVLCLVFMAVGLVRYRRLKASAAHVRALLRDAVGGE